MEAAGQTEHHNDLINDEINEDLSVQKKIEDETSKKESANKDEKCQDDDNNKSKTLNRVKSLREIALSANLVANNHSEVLKLTASAAAGSVNKSENEIEMADSKLNDTEDNANKLVEKMEMVQDEQNKIENSESEIGLKTEIIDEKVNETENTNKILDYKIDSTEIKSNLEKSSEPVIKIQKALCADYRSASESESDSYDSEKDSSPSSESDSYETDSDSSQNTENKSEQKKKPKKSKCPDDLSVADLPPIEDLKISVPEDECQEIGVVTSIVDSLVVVESYKGTAPLDIDSILFLDKGKRPLGKVFDVLGPVAEPVYTIRFTNSDQIKTNNVEKGMKVYCAPKTEHSSYVFLPDLLKMKGSDASWKDNMEAPPECQDFSDDEEEQRHTSVVRNVRNENNRRRNPESGNQDCQKRTRTINNYNARPPGKYITQSRFKNPQFQRSVNKFTHNSPWSYQPHTSSSLPPQSSPSYTPFPGPNPFIAAVPSPYPNNPVPFGHARFPNIPPFPPGNFLVNPIPPPPPPPPATSSGQNAHMSYPTRTTGPPPFSSFMAPPPGNRMPIPPFPFSQGFTQQQRFYSQPFQFSARPPPPPPPSSTGLFGPDIQGPPPV